MIDPPPPSPAPPSVATRTEIPTHLPMEQRPDGTLVIDLLPLSVPPVDCAREEPDPLNPEIVVCRAVDPSPRIGPNMLAEVDDFGNAVPRARLKLSDKATAEANGINQSVGGFNANGGEVRLKIDF